MSPRQLRKNRPGRSRAAPTDYLDLVRRHPLRPIRTVADYDAAAGVLDSLILRKVLSRGEKDYIEALSLFIEDYDRRHRVFDTAGRTPLDMLVHLLEANDLGVSDLGVILGSKGVASEVLHGKRALSKSHLFKLGRRFHVTPGSFWKSVACPAIRHAGLRHR